jgi:hypothetical protein
MPFRYHAGLEICEGDRVSYAGHAGEIELVVEKPIGLSEPHWLFEQHGAGVMVVEPKVFGRVYLSNPAEEEDLLFIARREQ